MGLKWYKIETPNGHVFESILKNGDPIYIQKDLITWKALIVTEKGVLTICTMPTPYQCQTILETFKFN